MSSEEPLESQLKKSRLQGAYEGHQVSATRVATRVLGSAVCMPWELADNFMTMPSLPASVAKGGSLISQPVASAESLEPVPSSSGKLELLRLAGVKVPTVPGPGWDQKLSEAREAALAKWLGIIERFPKAFGLSLAVELDQLRGRPSDLKASLLLLCLLRLF